MNDQGPILRFFKELDLALAALAEPGEKLDLYHLGRSALILHYAVQLSTKDIDVVQVGHQQSPLQQEAARLFGPNSVRANQLGMYLDFVLDAGPPLPARFRTRCRPVPADWTDTRARWEWGHAIIALVELIGFAALVGSVLADTPSSARKPAA